MQLLCVCTGNTCRSPMLAALLRRALEERELHQEVSVVSGGVAASPGMPASGHALAVMAEMGIDIADHSSQPVTSELMQQSDFAVCMSPQHAAALENAGMPGERIAVAAAELGGVPDPFGGSLEEYRQTAQVLNAVAQDIATRMATARDGSTS